MAGPRYLDQQLFAELASGAGNAPRGRQHHNFHRMEEPCHRMAVGLQPNTYIPPHRHLDAGKAEALIVLKGRLGLLVFAEDGELLDKRELSAAGDCPGVDLPPGVFHALAVLEPTASCSNARPGLTARSAKASSPVGRLPKAAPMRRPTGTGCAPSSPERFGGGSAAMLECRLALSGGPDVRP